MVKSTRISKLFSVVLLLVVLPGAANAYTVNTVEVVSTGNGANEFISVWGGGLDGPIGGFLELS